MNKQNTQLNHKFNETHHHTYHDKVRYNNAIADWLQSKVELGEWRIFTCTVIFKPIDKHNYQSRFEDEYKSRFLHKIRRRLDRSKSKHSTSIPYEHLFYFEREHKTLLRAFSRKTPFHIHSLIPIKTHQVHRFWSYDEKKLNQRLEKDLLSIDLVSNFLIEPVHETGSFPWLMYITKQKSL